MKLVEQLRAARKRLRIVAVMVVDGADEWTVTALELLRTQNVKVRPIVVDFGGGQEIAAMVRRDGGIAIQADRPAADHPSVAHSCGLAIAWEYLLSMLSGSSAKPDVVLLLHNDTLLIGDDVAARLAELAMQYGAAGYGPANEKEAGRATLGTYATALDWHNAVACNVQFQRHWSGSGFRAESRVDTETEMWRRLIACGTKPKILGRATAAGVVRDGLIWHAGRVTMAAKALADPICPQLIESHRAALAAGKRALEERRPKARAAEGVEIIICAHNHAKLTERCLRAVRLHSGGAVRVTVVDDGSTEDLSGLVGARTRVLRTEGVGYAAAANAGMEQSEASVVVLLNNDALVTAGWLDALELALASDRRIGAVGPLSNRATWQSVPRVIGPDRQWARNDLGATADDLGALVRRRATRRRARVPLLHGFCLAIRREALLDVGLFDADRFPAYCEDDDLCLRLTRAGWTLAVADDSFVWHDGSASYGPNARRIWESSRRALIAKHGDPVVNAAERAMEHSGELAEIRARIADALSPPPPLATINPRLPSVAFLLHVPHVNAGGAHIVVELAEGLRRLGARAAVFVPPTELEKFSEGYAGLAPPELFHPASRRVVGRFDVRVATINDSFWDLPDGGGNLYFVQDYEPWFYSDPRRAATARATYEQGAECFTYSPWVAYMLEREHGVKVRMIDCPLDSALYRPLVSRERRERGTLAVMLRPGTPWRRPEVTAAFARRAAEFADVLTFGCAEPEAERLVPGAAHAGACDREQMVRYVYHRADVVADFSKWQAFGRCALEAMACGCVAAVPPGAGFAPRESIAVDDSEESVQTIRFTLDNRDKLDSMQSDAARCASQFTMQRAALSFVQLLSRLGLARRG